jgi:hypothetical protein
MKKIHMPHYRYVIASVAAIVLRPTARKAGQFEETLALGITYGPL